MLIYLLNRVIFTELRKNIFTFSVSVFILIELLLVSIDAVASMLVFTEPLLQVGRFI